MQDVCKHGFVRQRYDCVVENLLLIIASRAWAHVEIKYMLPRLRVDKHFILSLKSK